MSIHENAMELLKYIYDGYLNGYASYDVSQSTIDSMSSSDRASFLASIAYLKDVNLLKPYAECKDTPVSVKITSTGINAIEKVPTVQAGTNITVNGNVSGIVGQNVTGNTINQGFSVEEFKLLLEKTVTNKAELQQINKELEPILKRIEIGSPLEKGLLASLKGHFDKYQTLYSSLLQVIGTYLLSKR